MAALTDRQSSRARLRGILETLLDRHIPSDESKPMRGQTFREFEDQADEFDRALTAAFLEELAALSVAAQTRESGCCPHCGGDRVYLVKNSGHKTELQSKHGVIVLAQQQCRCRSCDRTFSPSGPRLGAADTGEDVHAQGG
jgi:hypothetical protein